MSLSPNTNAAATLSPKSKSYAPPGVTKLPYNQRPLPPGWISQYDAAQQAYFYINELVDPPVTTWEDPRPAYYTAQEKGPYAPPRRVDESLAYQPQSPQPQQQLYQQQQQMLPQQMQPQQQMQQQQQQQPQMQQGQYYQQPQQQSYQQQPQQYQTIQTVEKDGGTTVTTITSNGQPVQIINQPAPNQQQQQQPQPQQQQQQSSRGHPGMAVGGAVVGAAVLSSVLRPRPVIVAPRRPLVMAPRRRF